VEPNEVEPPVTPVKPAEEKPKPQKAEGGTLADKIEKKLTSVNISLSGLPRAEVTVDEAEGAEVTVYVAKGFASAGRLHQLMRCARDALKECELTETESEELVGPGIRFATIRFNLNKV
jgi:hypothetical protein